jgi:beta-N-acetylhexosaminidase
MMGAPAAHPRSPGRRGQRRAGPPQKGSPVPAHLFWPRVGGAIVAGAALIACATTAAVGGTSASARPHHGRPAGTRRTATPRASATTAGTGASTAAGAGTSSGETAQATLAAKLSPRQLAGQRVIFSYSGLNPPGRLLYLIRHGDAAGVIFFGQNIKTKAQIAGVIRTLEAADAASTNPVHSPLLLMTDQEGGEVRRLPGRPDLSEKQIGESAHPVAAASGAGTGAAGNLLGVGMNVNLAPVLDVYRTPGDFDDQFQRSYSMNPKVVSALGAAFIKAQQKGRVAATAKHFPGLGAAARNQDTDMAPVTLNVSKASLRAIDEYPYKAAIKAGVKLVMVSWARYPALAPRPAGISTNIVQGELRQRLGFKGVTITDALEAGALRGYGSISNRAVLAGEAGMDLLLCAAQSVSEGVNCVAGLQAGYQKGSIGKAAFMASVDRVLSLRASLPK